MAAWLARIKEVPARRWWDLGFLALLAALSACFFLPLLGKAYYTLDFAPVVVPTFHWLHAKFAAGLAPLWTQDLMLGYPFLDEGLSGYFYPPQRLLLSFLKPLDALAYLYIFHMFLASSGAYLLARAMGLRPGAALLGAVVAGFGGGMAWSAHHPANLCSLAWLPWQFLGVELGLSEKRARRLLGTALLGLSLGMAAAGGHLVVSVYGGLALLIFAWQRWRQGKKGGLGRLLKAGAGAALLAALLAGGQLLATQRMVGQSVRAQDFTYSQAAENSLSPAALSGAVLPAALGGTNDNSFLGASWSWGSWIPQGLLLYVSLTGLLLAWLGWRGKDPHSRPFFWAALLLALYSLGSHFPLHRLAFELPVFGHFRGPMKAASLLPFLAGMLAAVGAQQFLKGEEVRPRLWIGAAVLAGLLLLGWGLLQAGKGRLEAKGKSLAKARASHAQLHSGRPPAYYQEKFARWQSGLGRHLLEQGAFAALAALLLGLAPLLLRRGQGEPVALALALLAYGELWRQGAGYFPVMERTLYEGKPETAKAIQGRFFAWGWSDVAEKAYPSGPMASDPSPEYKIREILGGDLALLYGLSNFRGYSPLPLLRHDLIYAGAKDFDPLQDPKERDRLLKSRRRFLDLGSVETVLSAKGLDWEGLRPVERKLPVKLYRNARALPLAWMAERVLPADSMEEAFEKAAASRGREVVLEGAEPERLEGGSAALVEQSDERWKLKVSSRGRGFLFLSRSHYEGPIQATVDGKPAALLPASGAFTGLWLEDGRHEVLVQYKDPLLPWALAAHWIGWLTLAALGAGLLASRKAAA